MTKKCETVLIDADVLLYQIAHNTCEIFEADAGIYYWNGSVPKAVSLFKKRVEEVRKKTGALHAMLCWSDHSDLIYRMVLYPGYKGNRRRGNLTLKAPHFHAIKQALLGLDAEPNKAVRLDGPLTHDLGWAASVAEPTLEADDLMGLYQNATTCIASIDKDLRTIPGMHLNLDSMKVDIVHPQEAEDFFHKQILMGDSTDGIPGCPGVGPKAAEKIMETDLDVPIWERIVAAYEKKGLTEEDAILNARLVRILRGGEYDFDTQEIHLWDPN